MELAENPYGDAKRLAFADSVIAACRPRSVLDVGCGSGELLTIPLAERHPEVSFLGVDSDAVSLRHAAARHRLANLGFMAIDALPPERTFDLVIASEVLEHVEMPHDFLRALRRRLEPEGVLLLTVPNGYGPAEVGQVAEAVLRVSGLFRLVRALWRALGLKRLVAADEPPPVNSLAVSPHINFFGRKALLDSLAEAGFAVAQFKPRSFLCGFGFDQLVLLFRLIDWNVRVAERLPPALVSDWMLLARPAPAVATAPRYRRGPYARFRRRLNRRRWGLA